MNIKCEAISRTHEFCIRKAVVKQLFEQCDIEISFKKGEVLPCKNAKLVPEKSAKHEVSILLVSKPHAVRLGDSDIMSYPLLNLYSVDKKYLSEQLKEQFAKEILPMLFDRYRRHKDDDAEVNGFRYGMEVYISDGKFEIVENHKNSF